MLPLDTERVFGAGPFIVDNYSVNYLFGLDQMCQKYVKKDFVVLELGVRDGISTSVFAHYAHTVIAVDKSIARRRSRRHKILNDNSKMIYTIHYNI